MIISYNNLLFLLIYVLELSHTNAQRYQGVTSYPSCPQYRLRFEKIIGFRPQIRYISRQGLLASAVTKAYPEAINYQCWKKCNDDFECTGYILYVHTSECYGVTTNYRSVRYQIIDEKNDLLHDNNAIYFHKVCLNVPDECKSKLWPITKIPGNSMVQQGKRTIPYLMTRTDCANACMNERSFSCLSANFILSHRNNYVRSNSMTYGLQVLGTCILSDRDKTMQPEAYRASTQDEEYIENQCAIRATYESDCSFETYADSTFVYPEVDYDGLTMKECQDTCTKIDSFVCLGATYFDPEIGKSYTKCSLHSDDSLSLGPHSVIRRQGALYMRRVKCLNITVFCTQNEMEITYNPYNRFDGRLYVKSHGSNCGSHGNGVNITVLRLPIGDETRESQCGIIRAYDADDRFKGNRTLLSTLVVIQSNPLVQTQSDRIVKVGCILNGYSTGGSSVGVFDQHLPVEGAVYVTDSDSHLIPKVVLKLVDANNLSPIMDTDLGQPVEMQVEATPIVDAYDIRPVELIAKSDRPGSNILLLDQRGCPTDPNIFPEFQRVEVNQTRTLYARFHAFKFSDGTVVHFELRIQFCKIQCHPIECSKYRQRRAVNISETTVDPSIVDKENKTLVTRLTPIKEPDKQQFDLQLRSRSLYDERSPNIYSLSAYPGFNENRSFYHQQVINRSYSEYYDMSHLYKDRNNLNKQIVEVPLSFTLVVRGANVSGTESLIYGENSQILVAGYDIVEKNNETICIDQTLFAILLLLWILLQLILLIACIALIRKYKRVADIEEDRSSLAQIHSSLDVDSVNRRVRWADERERDRDRGNHNASFEYY